MMKRQHVHRIVFAVVSIFLLMNWGCWRPPAKEIVVYTALDREFSEPIFAWFEQETGITVNAKYDTESTKTVGLTNAILAESQRPRCDVFWNNEILNTLRLDAAGLLRPIPSKATQSFPASYYSSSGKWSGFAARARVILVNTEKTTGDEPQSIRDLVNPGWKQNCAIAKPLFGTTASHAAILFERWGTEAATEFFQQVQLNAQVMSGNKQVALAVSRGQVAWGLTDTDDAMVEISKGGPVRIIYPDQATDQIGTLFIPNSLSAIAGSPNPQHAAQLIEFLLSERVERRLAEGPSAQIPLRTDAEITAQVETPATVRAMEVDFEAAGRKWNEAAKILTNIFAR